MNVLDADLDVVKQMPKPCGIRNAVNHEAVAATITTLGVCISWVISPKHVKIGASSSFVYTPVKRFPTQSKSSNRED